MELGPDEYLAGWDPSTSRLFLSALSGVALGARIAVRITIQGTGIGATVVGPVIAVRHVAGLALPPGGYLALPGRAAGAATYLARVARGMPVDFNERDPRFAVAWGVTLAGTLAGERGQLAALTENVSSEGCALTWRGTPVEAGSRVTLRRRRVLAPALSARVCWSAVEGGIASAGLHLEAGGHAASTWRAALAREVRLGAQPV
ncbi:MAG TPA: pilus assembly protein PilZ [Anaeromyxobacter sp.]|nr:pilus assembly protein PilZ [Anaeromyxobacter sp.]